MSAKEGKHRDAPAEGEQKTRRSLKERAAKIRQTLWAKFTPLPGRAATDDWVHSAAADYQWIRNLHLRLNGRGCWWPVGCRFTNVRIACRSPLRLRRCSANLIPATLKRPAYMAARVFAHGKQTDEERGASLYIIGAVTFRDAEVHEDEREKPRMYLLAARYLEEARDYGLPASHKIDGIETLAQCYFNVDRYAKALPILRAALDEAKENRRDLLWMLRTAYMRDANPQWKKALETNKEFLAQPDLTHEERIEALLLQARLSCTRSAIRRVASNKWPPSKTPPGRTRN